MASKSWTLLAALGAGALFGGCGGAANDGVALQDDSGGVGGSMASSAGSKSINPGGTAAAGASKGGAAGEAQGGATSNRCLASRDEPPGEPIYDAAAPGGAECADVTLADVLAQIRELRPDLADVTELYWPDPERGGDGSFIYAFRRPDGGFAVAFQRGSEDCPAGCIVKDYWYFETSASCQMAEVGEAHRNAGQCMEPGELPRWGIPRTALPSEICGADLSPQDVTGVYSLTTCGQVSECNVGKSPVLGAALPSVVELTIQQLTSDASRGSVTLQGTGEPLLDGVAFAATFARRKVRVVAEHSNLPAKCLEQWGLSFDYDFEGLEARHMTFDVVHTPECEGAPNEYCKGSIQADFGQAFLTSSACKLADCAELDEAECSARVASSTVGGCVPRSGYRWAPDANAAPMYAGCAPTCCTSDAECTNDVTAQVCAQDPDGQCWVLASPPVPMGWSLLSDVLGCDELPECAAPP